MYSEPTTSSRWAPIPNSKFKHLENAGVCTFTSSLLICIYTHPLSHTLTLPSFPYPQVPTEVPAPNRAHLATPCGLLFNELVKSPANILASLHKMLELVSGLSL